MNIRVPPIYEHVTSAGPRYLARLACLQPILGCIEARSFLEVGPGLGDVASYLVSQSRDARGDLVERSASAVVALRSRFRDELKITIHHDDFLSFQSGSKHDLFLAFEVLEHIPDDRAFLATAGEHLRVGGDLVVSTPCDPTKWQAVDDYAGHVRRYGREELCKKLERSGFKVISCSAYGFPLINALWPLRELYYRHRLTKVDRHRIEATEMSGIERPRPLMALRKALCWTMYPFISLQRWTTKTDLGDGYVVHATKYQT